MKCIIRIVIGLLIIGVSWDCTSAPRPAKSITVSIEPLAWITTSLVDDNVAVRVLVPSGSSPETYEPTARQIEDLSRSALYFSTGLLDFEGELASRIGTVAPTTLLVNLSDSVTLMAGSCSHAAHSHAGHNHGVDPHIWLSPRVMKRMIAQAAMAIAASGICNEKQVFAKRDSLLIIIEKIDKYIASKLDRSKSFAIVHPSLSYFAADYGLNQIALEVDGKEPSASAIRSIVDELRREQISTIFYGIQTSDAVARVVADEVGCTLTPFDPLPNDWPLAMRKITDDIYGTN